MPGIDFTLTFQDIILRVAREVGFAVSRADGSGEDIPTGKILQRVKDAVNDARDDFYRCYAHWTFLREGVTITLDPTAGAWNVEGDTGRIRLPWYVQIPPLTEWIYSLAAGGAGGRVRVAGIDDVRRAYADLADQTTGPPLMIAQEHSPGLDHQPGVRRPIIMRVWPRPDQTYTLTAESGRVVFAKMVDLSDREPAGSMHDQAIIVRAIYRFKRANNADAALLRRLEEDADKEFARSIALDQQNPPPTLGIMHDPSVQDRPNSLDHWVNTAKTTVDGVPI